MTSKKNLFTLKEENIETVNPKHSSIIPFLSSGLEQFFAQFPTPEEEIEELNKDEEILNEKIKEAEENLKAIEERIQSHSEEAEELQEKWELVHNLLESYEYDLKYNIAHKKSLNNIYFEEDDEKAEENFSNQLPELLATSIFSSKKKMEDVNKIVKKTEKSSTVRIIEECIYCECILKDDKGRKTSKQHFHFEKLEGINLDSFLYYKPVICVECIQILDKETNQELGERFAESSSDSENCCKKGSTVYSNNLSGNYPILIPYFEKIIEKEKEKNKEFLMLKPKNFSFDL